MFASVSTNRVTVYRCLLGGTLDIMQVYVDDHKVESFYTVCWMRHTSTGHPLIAASGALGVIRVIDCFTQSILQTFAGHGNSVNELRCQPLKPCLLLSASKDESVRLWNADTGVCVLILSGSSGHRNEVLSVDFHPSDVTKLVSCGMDSTVRIWCLKDFWHIVEKSVTWTGLPSKFPTAFVNYPLFVASDVHANYVDCVRWNGDLIFSKSVDNEVVAWKWTQKPENGPMERDQPSSTAPFINHIKQGSVDILQKYAVPECDIWFIRFTLNFASNLLAIGNRDGKVFLYDVEHCPPLPPTKLAHQLCKSVVRQTAISFDGGTILCCCEDGQIFRWDVKNPPLEG